MFDNHSEDSEVEDTIISHAVRDMCRDKILPKTPDEDEADSITDDGMVADDSDSEIEEYPRKVLRRTMSPEIIYEPAATYLPLEEPMNTTEFEAEVPETAQIPNWFPRHIKKIFATDHHGGALSYKELNLITHYRALISSHHRRKWQKYIAAGQARWKLQKIVRRLRRDKYGSKTAKHMLGVREKQYARFKDEALKRWKRLERCQIEVLVLDELVNANFLMERVIYKKEMDGGGGK